MAKENEKTSLSLQTFLTGLPESKQAEYVKYSAQHGLHNAMMRIMFEEWSTAEKEQIMEDILSESVAHRERSKIVYYALNVRDHVAHVRQHVTNVATCYQAFNVVVDGAVKEALGVAKEETNADLAQIARHDASKMSFEEAVTYAMKWHNLHPDLKISDEYWQRGLQHHYCNNEHHPEFWREGDRMPWRYLTEAVYDMAAIILDKKFKNVFPSDPAQLLDIDDQYLERFDRTGQRELVKQILAHTRSAMCIAKHEAVPN